MNIASRLGLIALAKSISREFGQRGVRANSVRLLCDVDASLFGPRGAAAVFGPQKGAGRHDEQKRSQPPCPSPELTSTSVEVAGCRT